MASNPPPSQAEDSTGKDFFDNLVSDSDDLDTKVSTASLATAGTLSSDRYVFDEGKALANLSPETENEDGGVEVLSDRTFVSKSSGEDSSGSGESGAQGVREVGWSAFHSDSVGNDGTGFGSYSDFFGELGGCDAGAFENAGHGSTFMESSSNWENQYPGWKYDSSTGQWYQIDGYDARVQKTVDSVLPSAWGMGNVAEIGRSDNDGYPPHMVFDPRYPGWYYDTITQKWHALESYTKSVVQSNVQVQGQMNPGGYASFDNFYRDNDYNTHGQDQNWVGPVSHYIPQCSSASQNEIHMPSCSPCFAGGNSSQQLNESTTSRNDHKNVSNNYYVNQSPGRLSQQNFQRTYAPTAGRSLAVRPAHALVTFGFGGKLVVLKHHSSTECFNAGRQKPVGGPILVLSLAEVVNRNADASSRGTSVHNYFQALYQRCVPGPLSSGSVGSKELSKWIDERIANPDSAEVDHRKAEVLKLLLSLLKIACQYYGNLRSPYASDAALKESDVPEFAIARLFASAKSNSSHFSRYAAVGQCLHQIPSERQMRVTAAEVQSLLVSGMKKEALECAQEGRVWGPALVLAAQLGGQVGQYKMPHRSLVSEIRKVLVCSHEYSVSTSRLKQFYVETIKKMALCQFVAGSPLRTLCLLIASQPAEVFSADSTDLSGMYHDVNMTQRRAQFGANGMLDCWEENLAVITANRTKDDDLVLIHLGDCLWKDRSDVNAAHICYLVAGAKFGTYSDTSRMCLVGADHWRFPRTYASPEAIQRTEVYEYSKTLGNSQFVLLPFQPYKLIYAYMLAEVGRMSDALKYCQAVLKSLKTGRPPDTLTLRHQVLSLEERIKAHQHGGFSTNLAPKRFVGKLLDLIDNTANLVVGGGILPPNPTQGGAAQVNENHQSLGPRVSTSQSTVAMSSLVPSQTTKGPSTEWAVDRNRKSKHTRSISEPDVGRSPRQGQADFSKDESSTGLVEKTSAAGRTSRLGRFSFGSQLFQKTVGFVLKPRQDRQAKLGETNKFYYDEKLKRWVEEGSDVPAAEEAVPSTPPSAVCSFQNQASYNSGNPYKSPSVVDNNSSGIPPIPPTSNQHSVRGRMGVRSRYVDTFNKGGEVVTNSSQSPSVSPVKPANRNFFVPTPAGVYDLNNFRTHENRSASPLTDSLQSLETPSSTTMQKIASLNNISNPRTVDNGSFPVQSRRTTSWGGGNVPHRPDVKPLGEVLGMHPSSFISGEPSMVRSSKNRDDLHEVEL